MIHLFAKRILTNNVNRSRMIAVAPPKIIRA